MSDDPQLNRIWKYEIPNDGEFELEAPRFLRIVHVETQGVVPCFWAIVRPSHPPVLHRFRTVATGEPFAVVTFDTYVGTFLLQGGALVYHLFYLGEVGEDEEVIR